MRADVVVVGGGPAGAATAARLAAAGARVVVLDRARFPRRKPCGECLSPAAVQALRGLGAWASVHALGPRTLLGWTVRGRGDAAFTGSFPDAAEGIALPREALDLALLEHAAARGARVRTGERVTGVLRQGGRVTGVRTAAEETIHADVVVGADGLRSVVARRLDLPRRAPRLRKIALTAHVAGVSLPVGRGELRVDGPLCIGAAQVAEEAANVTVVLAGAAARAAAGDAPGCFDRALAAAGIRGRRLDRVLSCGPFDFPMRRAAVPGAVLVGDAAGYFDPFTGQGIFRALRGAELAAPAVLAFLGGDGPALDRYHRAQRAAFRPGERLQHLVEAFVSRPAWLAWAAARLARHADLADALIAATGDLAPPRSLLRPRLLARLVA